jgi:hypothetical protein
MMVMPGTNSTGLVHWIAGKYPGRIGWLMGPTHRKRPRAWLPFALDNDAFSAWQKQKPWDVELWRDLLRWVRMTGRRPLWLLVPDVVTNREATLANWERYAPEAAAYGWPLAFAVQDGMQPEDVPASASVVFVGGSTLWKWRSLPTWAANFPRVHVGRVNELRRLWTCEDLGVESVDGSGWFMETDEGGRARRLLAWVTGERNETAELQFNL